MYFFFFCIYLCWNIFILKCLSLDRFYEFLNGIIHIFPIFIFICNSCPVALSEISISVLNIMMILSFKFFLDLKRVPRFKDSFLDLKRVWEYRFQILATGFTSSAYHLQALWPWTSLFTTLFLSSLIHKITPPLHACYDSLALVFLFFCFFFSVFLIINA